jgi:hypothetical protein
MLILMEQRWRRYQRQPQNDLLVLDVFKHSFTNEKGERAVSYGLIVSSRLIFRNVLECQNAQGVELVGATDGTYKLHFGS